MYRVFPSDFSRSHNEQPNYRTKSILFCHQAENTVNPSCFHLTSTPFVVFILFIAFSLQFTEQSSGVILFVLFICSSHVLGISARITGLTTNCRISNSLRCPMRRIVRFKCCIISSHYYGKDIPVFFCLSFFPSLLRSFFVSSRRSTILHQLCRVILFPWEFLTIKTHQDTSRPFLIPDSILLSDSSFYSSPIFSNCHNSSKTFL